jgi:cellulose synthase/poly-beta-1,6-N-acetylglucosamine synthase-like glycosyltransferase
LRDFSGNPLKKLLLYLLMAAGTALSVSSLSYCGSGLGLANSMLAGILAFGYFAAYLSMQVWFVWYLYCRFEKRAETQAPPDLTVDIFLTAFNEPAWIVKRAIEAAKNISYPHKTYLLDDSPGKNFEHLAHRLQVEYLTRNGNSDFKAGNLNAAMEKTNGDFIAIFDIDHVSQPDFLERTLGHFKDPQIGFVQVMQTYNNESDGLIARAALQTSCEYFNITACGKDAVGAMSHHGSNAVIRRSALESIGGYQSGLAEDLETSIRLHAEGWQSAYVCEPLAPGLAPASFSGFCRQQLKWSRGVFEAALRSLFSGTFFRLTWHQRLAYSVRFSYYLLGVSVFLGTAATVYHLFEPSLAIYETFLARMLPLTFVIMAIRCLMLRNQGTDPTARQGVHFKGASLIISIWPIYLLSALCTLFRISIPFMSTPKASGRDRIALWTVLPQVTMVALLLAGLLYKAVHWNAAPAPLTIAAAVVLMAQHWILFVPVNQILKNKFKKTQRRAFFGRQRQAEATVKPIRELGKAA